jgi:choline-sulfatase
MRRPSAVMATMLGLVGCDALSPPAVRPPNVVLVTLDTLRADVLGAYGNEARPTPNLDRIASEGTLFSRAYTVTPLTIPAHSSIHTGWLPPRHGVRDNGDFFLDDGALTLAERLRDAGYATMASVGAEVTSHHWGFAQGFEAFFDSMDGGATENRWRVERSGEAVLADAERWLAEPTRNEKPFFAWIHLFDVHHPYEPPEPYRSRYPTMPYQGEVAWTDELVGRLLAGLQARGQLENTWIVVVADHGEGLGSHGEAMHGVLLYDATTRVPFLVRPPSGVAPVARVEAPVSVVDVTPTVLGAVGLPIPEGLDGRDLSGAIAGKAAPDEARVVYAESLYAWYHYGWAQQRALVDRDWKWIDSTHDELYHRDEPDELANRLTAETAVVGRFDAAMAPFRAMEPVVGTAGKAAESAERSAQLEALGYLSGGEAPEATEGLPDPVDRLPVLQRVEVARQLLRQGRRDEAAAEFDAVIEAEPGLVEPRLIRAQLRAAAGDAAGALQAMEALVAERRSAMSMSFLGLLRFRQGDRDGGLVLLEEASRMDPFLASARVAWVRALALSGDRERFREEALAAHRALPEEGELMGLAGVAHAAFHDSAEAEPLLVRAQALRPDQPLVAQTLGLIRLQQGRLAEAETLLLDEVQAFPPALAARDGLVRIYAEQRRYAEQLEQLEALAAVAPPDAVMLHARAQALFNLGRYDDARTVLADCTVRYPESAACFLLLANAEKKLGRSDAAQAAFERAKALRPR